MRRAAVLLLALAGLVAALEFGLAAGFSPLVYDALGRTLPPSGIPTDNGMQPFEARVRVEQGVTRFLAFRLAAGYEGRVAFVDRGAADFRQSRMHGFRADAGVVAEFRVLKGLALRAGAGAGYAWHRVDRDLVEGYRYRSEGTLAGVTQTFLVGLRWRPSGRFSVLVEAEPAGVSWVVERGRVFNQYERQAGEFSTSVLVPDAVPGTGITLGVAFGS